MDVNKEGSTGDQGETSRGKIAVTFGEVTISSNFDSGVLLKVVLNSN